MKSALSTLLVCTLSPMVSAQSLDSVHAKTEEFQVRPARPGDEGAPRFDVKLKVNPSEYIPRTPPAYEGINSGVAGDIISYDVETGEETITAAPRGPFSKEGGVAGTPISSLFEDMEAFGSPVAGDPTVWPWTMHCRVFFTDPMDGLNYLCSGTLIDPKTLITAGHCVHGGPSGTWMTNVVVSPAWDGDDDYAGSANGSALTTWTAWSGGADFAGDQGYVRLDRPLGALSSWLGYGYNDDTNWWYNNQSFFLTGWPGGGFSGAPNQFYFGAGTFDAVTSGVVTSTLNWSNWIGGMSGGGVYWLDGDNRYVGANVSHGTGFPNVTNTVGCCRIDSAKFHYIRDTYIPSHYQSNETDLVPLRYRAGNSSAPAGGYVENQSYVVFNSSEYDPSNRIYYSDVYLSTNDNISELDTLIQTHSYARNFGPKSFTTVTASDAQIPLTTAPGSYYVGVVIDYLDGDITNNDTDGWDAHQFEVLPPPNSNLTLQGLKSPGNPVWTVTGATPFATIHFLASVAGGGPTSTPYGNLDLDTPLIALGQVTADANGKATLTKTLPSGISGRDVWFQAADATALRFSNGIYARIQ